MDLHEAFWVDTDNHHCDHLILCHSCHTKEQGVEEYQQHVDHQPADYRCACHLLRGSLLYSGAVADCLSHRT